MYIGIHNRISTTSILLYISILMFSFIIFSFSFINQVHKCVLFKVTVKVFREIYFKVPFFLSFILYCLLFCSSFCSSFFVLLFFLLSSPTFQIWSVTHTHAYSHERSYWGLSVCVSALGEIFFNSGQDLLTLCWLLPSLPRDTICSWGGVFW